MPNDTKVDLVEETTDYIGVAPTTTDYADPEVWDVYEGSGAGGYMGWWDTLTTAELVELQGRGNVVIYVYGTDREWERP